MLMPNPSRPAMILVAALALATSGIDHAPPAANPAVAPEPIEGVWRDQHEAFVERARQGNVGLLFLGDSMTSGWFNWAQGLWDRLYGPRKAVNFGIGGDHIQHLLWRLDHGELDGIRPKVVVLMIGTNNLPHQSEDQVVEGVRAVLGRIRRKLPDSKILFLGITPRGLDRDMRHPDPRPDPRVAWINGKLAKLADPPVITYLDFGARLLDDRGQVVPALQPDLLHLSLDGYRIWADATEPTLRSLMGEAPG